MGKRRRIGRDRPDQEPAEHDADGEKQGTFERLSVVELSEPKKDAGEDQRNDFPPRIGYTWAHRCGSGPSSLNQLIRSLEHQRRDRQAEGLGGLEVDDQLELRGLFDGQVGGLPALDDQLAPPPRLRPVRAKGRRAMLEGIR